MGRSFFIPFSVVDMSLRLLYKGMYAGRSAWFQLFVLLVFIAAGAVVASLTGGMLALVCGFAGTDSIMNNPDMMRGFQFISTIGTFLLPSLALAWCCSTHVKEHLSIRPVPSAEILLLTVASMFLISPAISLTGALNQQMTLPEFMAPVENWMRQQEDTAQYMMDLLLQNSSLLTLLSNLIVIAVMAGITEEFLFRGALQRIIERWTPNHHVVIWMAAILFSLFHLQFFGFFPRMLLGAYFGYLLYWGRSIWLPVFAHFINNAVAVIGLSDSRLKDNEYISGDISADHLLQFTLIALLTTLLFIGLVRYLRKMLLRRQANGD